MSSTTRSPFLISLLSLLTCSATLAADPTVPSADLADRARAVLSPLAGDLTYPGLRQPVEVCRDRWGIAHIYAQNQHDLFFAQGVVAAQDRLFQLELWRRVGRGETAAWWGAEAIAGDRFARLIRYRGPIDAEWRSYAPDAEEIATAFTAGINAQLAQLGDRLPIEFQVLGLKPQPWEPADVLTRMSGIVMTGNWQRELARARLLHAVGPETAARLAPTDPVVPWNLDPSVDAAWFTADIGHGYQVATRPLQFRPSPSESNNWVVSGQRSASGHPLLASDPHRAIALPSLRYLVHLQAPGWNVIGSGEPGLPGVALGHNERIAWGFTIVGTDQADLYVERTHPDDPRQYRVGTSWQPMTIVHETLEVRGQAAPTLLELRYTAHGPVIYQDEARGLAYVLRWAGAEPGGAAYLGSLSVARAQNWPEFLRALEAWKVPGLNFVYADVAGHIGWIAAALTPRRQGWSGLLPVPGDQQAFEWRGFLPVSELPQEFDPPRQWLATANHNILPPGYRHEIAYDWEPPFRFERIQERLQEDRRWTLDDFQRLQHDSTSLAARHVTRLMANLSVPAELQPYRALLAQWDGNLTRDSSAAALYSVWLQQLEAAFYARSPLGQLPVVDRGSLRPLPRLLRVLSEPQELDLGPHPVAARDALMVAALERAVAQLHGRLGARPADWRWEQLHTVTFRHPLAARGAEFAAFFNRGPVPRAGDGTTPHNTRYNEQFEQVHGATYRHLLDLADWDRGLATSAPGQSGQPGSPHYDDLLPLWANEQYFPLVYSRAQVERVTRHRLWLRP